jgi:two-component system response regulator YesN
VLNINYKSLNKSFGTSTDDILLLDFCIKNVFTEILGEAGKTILLTESIHNFIAVAETVGLEDNWQELMHDLCVRASNIIMEKLEVKLYIGGSEAKYEIEELFDCYNQACYALDKAVKEDSPFLYFQELKYEIPQNAFSKSVSEALEYIESNFQNDISLKEVAEAVYLNVWYLSDLFKREVGVTFSEYIRDKRIHMAKELLRDKSLKLYEVAYRIGIKEQGYFSTLFKKATGLSPTSYREQLD